MMKDERGYYVMYHYKKRYVNETGDVHNDCPVVTIIKEEAANE